MRRKSLAMLAVTLLVAAMAVAPQVVAAQDAPLHAGSGVPRYQHIFVIMMENHSYDQIIGNSDAPAINALAQSYGLATDYYGVTHPSEPNYVALVGGSYFGIQDDAPYTSAGHTIDAPSIADQLEAAGLAWKDYQQSLPYPGFTGTTFPGPSDALYASKHNPFMNFVSTQTDPAELAKMVPDTQLAADLQRGDVPNFGLIVPDQCHDMHGIAACNATDTQLIQAGDAYVGQTVNAIMAATFWRQGNNAIVITWDENDFSSSTGCCASNPGGGLVATVVVTSHGPRGVQDPTPYNHYSLLQTIQDAFHLGCLQNTCNTGVVTPMTTLFRR